MNIIVIIPISVIIKNSSAIETDMNIIIENHH